MTIKVAVFGGTGMTGVCAVEEALKMGKSVRMLVRNENRIPENLKEKVEFVVGDVTEKSAVKQTLRGTDQVAVILGTRNKLDPTTELSIGLQNIVSAMPEFNLKQISVCLSAFLFSEQKDIPAIFHNIDSEHRRMLSVLHNSKNLDWIAVYPPHITDGQVTDIKLTIDTHCGVRVVSKQNLGKFMISCLDNKEFYQHAISIANDA